MKQIVYTLWEILFAVICIEYKPVNYIHDKHTHLRTLPTYVETLLMQYH